MENIQPGGERIWYIPDCYYPEKTTQGHYVSHEAICVLNTGKEDAKLDIILYFEDREPMKDFKAECRAERTNHIRLDEIRDEKGNGIPKGVAYSVMLKSNVPVIVQYSRLDTTQAELGLMTTIAYPLR